jgi:hypothetical protein
LNLRKISIGKLRLKYSGRHAVLPDPHPLGHGQNTPDTRQCEAMRNQNLILLPRRDSIPVRWRFPVPI